MIIRHYCQLLGLISLGFAAACSPAPADTAPAASGSAMIVEPDETADHKRPVLMPAGLDIVPVVEQAGAPWDAGQMGDSSSYTASLGLRRLTVYYPRGMVIVDRTDDGGIYLVRVQSGIAEQCGSAAPLGRVYLHLYQAMSLPVLQPEEIAQLQRGWAGDDGREEVVRDGVMVRAMGGCRPTLTVRPAEAS